MLIYANNGTLQGIEYDTTAIMKSAIIGLGTGALTGLSNFGFMRLAKANDQVIADAAKYTFEHGISNAGVRSAASWYNINTMLINDLMIGSSVGYTGALLGHYWC